MASWSVVGRTDELQYDFRFWCSKVASTNYTVLEKVSNKLGMNLENDSHDSRQKVAEEMLKQFTAIKEDVFSRRPNAPGIAARMEDQPSRMTYNDKRHNALEIIFHSLRQMRSIPFYPWPRIYAKYKKGWQRTTFTDTSETGKTKKTGRTKIKRNTKTNKQLPEWILNSDHEIVRFLKEEPEEFGYKGHLVATNALYVIAVEMPEPNQEVYWSRSEGECQQDVGEDPRQDESSSNEESCDEDEETCDTEFEYSDEDDEEDEEGRESEKKKRKYSDEDDEEDEEGRESEKKKRKVDTEDEENLQDDESSKSGEESEDEKEEDADMTSQASLVHYNVGKTVHYYVGKTLRDVVRRYEDHYRNAKFLLDEAKKDTYSKFQDYESVVKEKKVLLVDAYLAAAIASQPAPYRCAVVVVRHFVDRQAELIQRFRLSDMKQGLHDRKWIQTKMMDYWTTVHQDDPARAGDS